MRVLGVLLYQSELVDLWRVGVFSPRGPLSSPVLGSRLLGANVEKLVYLFAPECFFQSLFSKHNLFLIKESKTFVFTINTLLFRTYSISSGQVFLVVFLTLGNNLHHFRNRIFLFKVPLSNGRPPWGFDLLTPREPISVLEFESTGEQMPRKSFVLYTNSKQNGNNREKSRHQTVGYTATCIAKGITLVTEGNSSEPYPIVLAFER